MDDTNRALVNWTYNYFGGLLASIATIFGLGLTKTWQVYLSKDFLGFILITFLVGLCCVRFIEFCATRKSVTQEMLKEVREIRKQVERISERMLRRQ